MDNRLLDALRNAPSLDLCELSLAISQMMTDPKRILRCVTICTWART